MPSCRRCGPFGTARVRVVGVCRSQLDARPGQTLWAMTLPVRLPSVSPPFRSPSRLFRLKRFDLSPSRRLSYLHVVRRLPRPPWRPARIRKPLIPDRLDEQRACDSRNDVSGRIVHRILSAFSATHSKNVMSPSIRGMVVMASGGGTSEHVDPCPHHALPIARRDTVEV